VNHTDAGDRANKVQPQGRAVLRTWSHSTTFVKTKAEGQGQDETLTPPKTSNLWPLPCAASAVPRQCTPSPGAASRLASALRPTPRRQELLRLVPG
jgi:hypothetical protein